MKLLSIAVAPAPPSNRPSDAAKAMNRELIQRSPTTEWVEDKEGKRRELFHVPGFPTMFVVGNGGKIAQVIAGVPEPLQAQLLASLAKPHGG